MHIKFLVVGWYKLSGGNRETLLVVIRLFGFTCFQDLFKGREEQE